MLKYDSLKEKWLITEGEYKQKIAECKTKIENMEKKAKEQENEGKVKDEAKKNKEKKGGIGILWIWAIIAFWVLLAIVVLWLFIAWRNTREWYSYDTPAPNLVELNKEDEESCVNWLKIHLDKDLTIEKSRAEMWSWTNVLYVIGSFTTKDYMYFNSDFMCTKDLSWELGKNHNWMFGLFISWRMVDEDVTE